MWIELDDGIEATGISTSFTDQTISLGDTIRYYRVREQQ